MNRKIFQLVLILVFSCAATVTADPTPTAPNAEIVAPGLKHFLLTRGEAATGVSYRISLGVFGRQSEADQMLERLRKDNLSAVLAADGTNYRVFASGLSLREEAETTRRRLVDLGYPPPLNIEEVRQDLTHPGGPWKIHVLEADPEEIAIRVAHAYDAAIGLETTAELAARRGAPAAINGGYFQMRGLLAGDSQGALQIEGTLLSEPDRGRASVGFYDSNGVTRSVFGRLGFRGAVNLGDGESITIDGINRGRGSSEVILYTPEFHRTTLTPPHGAEVVIENGRITSVREGAGCSVVPPNGAVLSIGSQRERELVPRFRHGNEIAVETSLIPLLPDPENDWENTEFIVSGGPLLLWNGRRLEEPEKESISRVFFLARHPRTAAGVRADGTLLFVTVDGRRAKESVGMSIPELTDLMLELGCVSAINLDGGGSTTMVIEGKTVNRPSSSGGDRQNGDAILLFPRAEKAIRN